jgi:cytochrome c peroxidase
MEEAMKTRELRRRFSLIFGGPPRFGLLVMLLVVLTGGALLRSQVQVEDRTLQHVDQAELNALVAAGHRLEAFLHAFETGDEVFGTPFEARDGVGANVGRGQRFTRVPRADLFGLGEWMTHTPTRASGPNGQACENCHNQPAEDGAGGISGNVIRDPFHTASIGSFIQRNAPHLFAIGAVQRLAEEMTDALHATRAAAQAHACQTGQSMTRKLEAKGIDFGRITVACSGTVDASAVEGVNADLVVRPFQWKGSDISIRAFNRGAAHTELGMQPVEISGDDVDSDGDGVVNELSVGDITALTVYNAAQPRPTTRVELAAHGLSPPLSSEELAAIESGRKVFQAARCATCHVPRLTIANPIFSEPSQNANYRDDVFPAGQSPLARGVSPALAITFDLTQDQPDNHIVDAAGNVFRLGSLQKDASGNAIVELFGDLKRHDMGACLAESVDEVGTGASVFLTENLWGVGSTAPYLHDGRASTLREAILGHCGEADSSKKAFLGLSVRHQDELFAFLNNLVLFKQ